MPKKQRYAMDNVNKREERFRKIYNLIGSDGVQIGIKFRENNQVTFNIVKDDEIIELFVVKNVARYKVDEILIQDENFVILDRFTPKDEGYSLWKNLLQESQAKNIKLIETHGMQTGLYDGKVFLNSILPSLGKALNPHAVGRLLPAQSINNNLFADDTELARLQVQREKESEATSTSTQSINGVSVDPTETTTEYSNFISDNSEATSTSTQSINGVSSTTVDTTTETTTEDPNFIFNITSEATSTSTQSINEASSTTVDTTTETTTEDPNFIFNITSEASSEQIAAISTTPFNLAESTTEEKEHLESTMQEIRESNTSTPTPSKSMEDGTLNNGEVSIHFGPRQNILEHSIRIFNSNDTAEPTPVPQDSAGGSYLAAAISFGILIGLIGLVVLVGLGTAYYMRKRSGSYDANKVNRKELPEASTETNTSSKLLRLESVQEELEERSSTDLPEEANPLLPEASTGIKNPPAKSPRLAEVVVHEGQQGAEGQIPMSELEMDLLQKAASSARSNRRVTTVPGEEESPRGSLSDLTTLQRKASITTISEEPSQRL